MKKGLVTMSCIIFTLLVSGCGSNTGEKSNVQSFDIPLTNETVVYENFDTQEEPKEKKHKKDEYYTIVSCQDGEILYTLKGDEELRILNDIISSFDVSVDNMGVDVSDYTPKYKYICYQEKTLLAGQNLDSAKTYEEILNITTYADVNFVTININPAVVKNMLLPQEIMNFTFEVSADTSSALNNIKHFKQN